MLSALVNFLSKFSLVSWLGQGWCDSFAWVAIRLVLRSNLSTSSHWLLSSCLLLLILLVKQCNIFQGLTDDLPVRPFEGRKRRELEETLLLSRILTVLCLGYALGSRPFILLRINRCSNSNSSGVSCEGAWPVVRNLSSIRLLELLLFNLLLFAELVVGAERVVLVLAADGVLLAASTFSGPESYWR